MPIYSNRPVNPARSACLKLLAIDQAARADDIVEYRAFYNGDHGALLS